jgi:hypothetical protein
MKELSIDFETADRIVRLTLTEWRDYLQSEIDNHIVNGTWLHPEDLPGNREYIYCVNKILEAYGGELYGERETGKPYQESSMVEASKRLEAYFLEVGKKSTKQKD